VGGLAQDELRGSDVIEGRGLFLLDQVFENAYVVSLQNLDSKRLIQLVTENKAVERAKLSEIRCFRGMKDGSKEDIVST